MAFLLQKKEFFKKRQAFLHLLLNCYNQKVAVVTGGLLGVWYNLTN